MNRMEKVMGRVFASLIFMSPVCAGAYNFSPFIGFDVGYSALVAKKTIHSGNSSAETHMDGEFSVGMKFGANLNGYRAYIDIGRHEFGSSIQANVNEEDENGVEYESSPKYDGSSTLVTYTVNVDYAIELDPQWSLYFGPHCGLLTAEHAWYLSGSPSKGFLAFKDSTFALGMQASTTYEMADFYSIEAGVRATYGKVQTFFGMPSRIQLYEFYLGALFF